MSKSPSRKRSKRITLINGVRVRRKPFFVTLGVIAGFALFFFAATVFLTREVRPRVQLPSDDPAPPSEGKAAAEEEEPAAGTLGDLLRRHLRSVGLEGCNSLAFNGSYKTGNQTYQLFILAKRPGLVRHAIRGTDSIVSAVYDGRESWIEFSLGDEPAEKRAISPLNARILRLECQFPALFWHYKEEETEGLRLAGTVELDGVFLQGVENTSLLDVPVTHYLDPETGLERMRRARVPVGDRVTDVEIRYGPYLSSDGIRWPESYELYLDDERTCVARLESARINAGVVPMLFQPRAGTAGSPLDRDADGDAVAEPQ